MVPAIAGKSTLSIAALDVSAGHEILVETNRYVVVLLGFRNKMVSLTAPVSCHAIPSQYCHCKLPLVPDTVIAVVSP